MVRNKYISDEGTSNSRRESSYRGRGRGRGRGRYSKNYRYNYQNSSDQPDSHQQDQNRSKYYADSKSYPEDENQYEEAPGGDIMEDLYDDRPDNQDSNITEGTNEGRSLQERISMPKNDHYSSYESAGDRVMDDESSRYENTVENEYHTGQPPPAHDDGAGGTNKESGVSKKETNPEELRQKVLESLAEKKKKAAEFMNLEKEGASIYKDQPIVNKAAGNNAGDGSGEAMNPEREAAVDALLATFGSGKEENGAAEVASRKNSGTEIAPIHTSPGASDSQQLKHEQYKLGEPRPPSHGDTQQGPRRASDYYHKYDDHDRQRDSRDVRGKSRDPSLSSGRYDQRGEGRKTFSYDDDERKAGGAGGRQDPRYRYDRGRFEDAIYSKETKGPGSSSGRKPDRYLPVTDDRRDPRDPRSFREPAGTRDLVPFRGDEVSRADHPKDAYGAMKPPRYPTDPNGQDVEYNGIGREYPPIYPGATPRYPSREDSRYAPAAVPRPAETNYAALYYRDLGEWLELTGYHDYPYRQMHLQRNREARALEESRYALEPGFASRISRVDDSGPRGSIYTMPPPPVTSGSWDDREVAAKRGLPAIPPVRSGYPPIPEDRGNYRGDELLSGGKTGVPKRRPRDEEFGEQPHSAKSARHTYENSHRYGTDGGSRQGDDAGDEAEAVRQLLSRRIATARDRDASPSAADRARRRSMSPRGTSYDVLGRDLPKDNRSPGLSPNFEHGRGRATSKYTPRDDFKKPFRPRHDSFGDSSVPCERKPFGRGRGRGMYKDYMPYGRNEHNFYERRSNQNNMGELVEMDRPSGFPSESMRNPDIRYFMIKSFNQDNVKMAQQDNIWATQQKNAEILEQAFKEARDVLLFFSINKSGKFQGYARMEGLPGSAPVPMWANNLLWESSGPFRIKWISITDISFHRVAHLKNRFNENQPVLIGRDGQEIDPDCGAALCKTIDETSAFRKLHGGSSHKNNE